MINRILTRRVELLPDEDLYGLKDRIELEYYLLESEIDYVEELEGMTAYGIEIVKNSEGNPTEKKTIQNLFCSKLSTEQLLDFLARNTVTPVALPFILDDMIGV